MDGQLQWGRARWRLRDLRGRERWLAIGMLVLVLVPFAVALVRAFHDGWVPSGDEANIATRALDVFSRHPPLTGLPSTSAAYGDQIATNHPGPMEFYLLALPLRVLGMSAGPLLTAAAINAACVLIALWVFFRRLGLTAMLGAGVLLLAVMGSAGTAVLTDTLSSNMTMYSVLCTTVLAWALVDGDLRLLALAALVASYAAQQHLAAGLIVLPLVAVAVAALGAQVVRRIRAGDAILKRAAVRWSAAAAAIAAVCWAPVLDDQVRGHPGNLTAIVRFARDNKRPTLGIKSGLYQAVHAVTPPPTILGRTDTGGFFFLGAPGPFRLVLFVAVVAALGAIAWTARARLQGLARLALVALVLLAAGIFNGSNVPHSPEESRINLYRWTWSAGLVTWAALGIAVAVVVVRAARRRARGPSSIRRARQLVPVALIVSAALIATSIVFVHGRDDHNRELPAFAAEKRIAAVVLARIDRHRPVLVVENGNDANLSVGPYVIFRLIRAGVKVQVSPFSISTYGRGRAYRPRSNPLVLTISSEAAQRPFGPGQLLTVQPFGPSRSTQFDVIAAARNSLLDDLSAAALGVKVELAPGAGALMARQYAAVEMYKIAVFLATLPTNPRAALGQPDFLRLVLAGRLRAPAFDLNKVFRLLTLPPTPVLGTYGDEQVEVRLSVPAQPSGSAP
jgi:hypothetical protein